MPSTDRRIENSDAGRQAGEEGEDEPAARQRFPHGGVRRHKTRRSTDNRGSWRPLPPAEGDNWHDDGGREAHNECR